MKAPRYMISYTFTAGRIGGSGYMDDYRPLRDGKPCVLSPEHMRLIPDSVAEGVQRDTGYGGAKITIVSVWRYEEDAEVPDEPTA